MLIATPSSCAARSRPECRSAPRLPWEVLVFILLLSLNGCASAHRFAPAKATGREALEKHVRFLSQKELNGRKPQTKGSRLARQYIEEHFEQYNLTPWGKARNYEWPFGRGVNIVGFLQGTDPGLSNQLVLVSAHYDHLGKDKDGIHPGAADNASGVAALLETARRLCQERPKRSVLFVAFDCEEMMLFGSFAFTCDSAVQQARIVAVVNVDMLGRKFLDVVDHTVFVVGTEQYPNLRQEVRGYGAADGIRILPLSSELTGPRSDHVAFESLGVPCLFFSCGSFRDYHEAQDTADKLDYEDVERATEVIAQTARALANANELEAASEARTSYADDLLTVHTVMTEVGNHLEQAGIRQADDAAFRELDRQAERLLATGRFDRKSRRKLSTEAAGVLAPYLVPQRPGKKSQTAEQRAQLRLSMQCLQEFYSTHHDQVLEGYRKFVAQILKYRPGLIRGMPKFEYSVYDVADDDIALNETGRDRYTLNALGSTWTMAAEVKWSKLVLKSFNASLGLSIDDLNCEGTREQLLDYCLFRWHAEQSNALHAAGLKKVIQKVAGSEPCADFKTQFKIRLQSGGFTNANDWMLHCLAGRSAALQLQALQAATQTKDERLVHAARKLLLDPEARADVRKGAIKLAAQSRNRESLLALCDLINDSTPAYRREYLPMLQSDYPFIEYASVQAARQELDKWFNQSPEASKTLGQIARKELKNISKRDLGDNPQNWRTWIEKEQKARRRPR